MSQAISFHVSLLTGRWGPDDTVATTPSSNPQFFDNDLIASQMNVLAEQDKQWRLFFARNGISPLVLSYEAIQDDLAGALLKIVTSFALPIFSRDFSYVENVSNSSNTDAPPKSWIRARFLGATSRISQAPMPREQIKLSDVADKLSDEGRDWIKSLTDGERGFIQTIINNSGPELFIDHWRWHKEMLKDLKRPSDDWSSRSARSMSSMK